MNHDQVARRDFPAANDGYDRASVDAHLEAVAAQLTALEARINSYEVEREALRRQTMAGAQPADVEVISEAAAPGPEPATSAPPEPITPTAPGVPKAQPPGIPAQDEVSARLIATKMALDGAERDKIRARLEETYELEDVDALLDDVIERVS